MQLVSLESSIRMERQQKGDVKQLRLVELGAELASALLMQKQAELERTQALERIGYRYIIE